MPAEESAPPAVEALWERDQVSLSEAERLLAENRARLRAAGIVAAAASDADESVSEGVAGGVAGGALGGSAVGKNGGGAPQEKHARPSAPAQGYGGAASSSPAKRKDAAARAPTPWPASEAPAGDDAGGVCLRICELTAATCELKARICALASRHAGDARYEAVCTQATTDCALASRACSSCAA
jgi:hypothetical protein